MKGKPLRERDLQRQILDYLAQVPGVYAWKSGGGMFRLSYKGKERMVRMGKKGVSDIIGWTRARSELGDTLARFIAIEVKSKRPVTLEQQVFLDRVRQAGGIAILAHSVDDVAKGLGLR